MNPQQHQRVVQSERERALEEAAMLVEQRRFRMPPGDRPLTVIEATEAIANAIRRMKP